MRKLLIILLAVFMTTSIPNDDAGAAAPAPAPAKPRAKAPYAVDISPNLGFVHVREEVSLRSIRPDLHSFIIYVPAASSLEEGMDVHAQGFGLNSVSSRLLLPEDDPAGSPRGAVVKRLKAARQEKSRLDGKKQALDTRMRLWMSQTENNNGDAGLPNSKDLEGIDAALAVKLPEIYAELAELPEQLREAETLVRYLEDELNALGGERPQLAEITVTITGSATPGQKVMVDYAYFSYQCGWWPSYTFDADPIKGKVLFRQQANIRQNSGQDWNGVEVSLSTKAPDFRLRPRQLRVWNLSRSQPAPRVRMSDMTYEVAAAAPPMELNEQPKRQQAVSMELGTHREWKLGKVSLSSSAPANIDLERKEWQGDFYYTLRPSIEEAAFLTAKIKLDEAVELPQGTAAFLVDSRLAGGESAFKAGGKELELFFGKDEMISVETQDLVSMKGQERFILKTNTYNWHWSFKVENKRGRAVKVRVEDPIPQARDASIKLKVESSPKAAEDYRSYYWETTIPASGDFVIDHKVEAKASGSDPLVPGR